MNWRVGSIIGILVGLAATSGAIAQSVFHVNGSAAPGGNGLTWATAFNDLQPALEAAGPGSGIAEIWVASGTYRPDGGTGNPALSFGMRSGLRVLGGFVGTETSRAQRSPREHPTVLSGLLAGGASSYHVVTADLADATALLDGFVIEGGKALDAGVNGEGGGIRGEKTSMRIASCTFRGNHATRGGAGYLYDSEPLFFNCVFAGNTANYTAGLSFKGDNKKAFAPWIVNCTFVGNIAALNSEGTALTSSLLLGGCTIRNAVFWNNDYTEPSYYPAQFQGKLVASYTCASESGSPSWPPVAPQPNALYSDPLFIDADGADDIFGTGDDDVRLRPGSPCIDSGDGDSIPADTFDLDDDGNIAEPWPLDLENGPREYDDPNTPNTGGGTVNYADMGAFEGPALAIVASPTALNVLEGTSLPFNVALTRPPLEPVDVTVVLSGDTDLTASPLQLTFAETNWSTPQAVQIEAVQDPDAFEGDATATISSPGLVGGETSLREIEDDTPPGIIYVNINATGLNNGSSWTNAFKTLSAAIVYAQGSGGLVNQIWVAKGTYKPAGTSKLNSFTMLNGVAMLGGFAGSETSPSQRDLSSNPTILTADVLGNDGPNFTNYADNRYHVITADQVDQSAIIDGFVIQGGSAMGGTYPDTFGGGLFVKIGTPTILNCHFLANQSKYKGGGLYAIYTTASGPVIRDCTFESNSCYYSDGSNSWSGIGGGLMIEISSFSDALTIERCRFIGNRAALEGGGASITSHNTTLIDCEFEGNTIPVPTSSTGGAALWLYVQPQPFNGDVGFATMSGCVFEGNSVAPSTSYQVAGMYCAGTGLLSISDSVFKANSASGTAALYTISPNQKLESTLVDCQFVGNYSSNSAVMITVGPSSLSGCQFKGNTCDKAGIAFTGFGPISQSVFVGNKAAGPTGVLSTAGDEVTDCVFIDNEVHPGVAGPAVGAVAANTSTFRRCLFQGNKALGLNARAGAVHGQTYGSEFVDCLFLGNVTEGDAGAIFGVSTGWMTQRLTNCVFIGNSAAGDGGAFVGDGILTNCLFANNSAGGVGGAVRFESWSGLGASLVHCTIANNSAGECGGVYMEVPGSNPINLKNCIVWGNTHQGVPGQAAQLGTDKPSSVTLFSSNVQDWAGSLNGFAMTSTDPLWVDPIGPDGLIGTGDEDFGLQPTSPSIDAANNAWISPDWFDLDADGDLTEPTPLDLAFRSRRIDDPLTPDTGAGSPPLADLGAYEFDRQESSLPLCYADCDESGVLTIDDFICFQTLFALGDPAADCDASGGLSIDDFICFQTYFAIGC